MEHDKKAAQLAMKFAEWLRHKTDPQTRFDYYIGKIPIEELYQKFLNNDQEILESPKTMG